MLKMKTIREAGYCRECLNKAYGVELKRTEVDIYIYPDQCERCKEVKNIVYSIKPCSRWKLLLAKIVKKKTNNKGAKR